MLPHPSSRSAPGANSPPPLPLPDLALVLEQHVVAGFPPDLALDLVLNELVARAADATHATAAALALLRGKQMVCRAATGLHAPDLGTPLDTRDGLSGACVRLRTPQVSNDTDGDLRVDPVISRRLGIRSMLVVPVLDHKKTANDRNPPLAGVLEVFSPLPNAFSEQAQVLLADFADECARIFNLSTQLKTRPRPEAKPADDDLILSDAQASDSTPETTGQDAGSLNATGMNKAGTDDFRTDTDEERLSADLRSLPIEEETALEIAEPELIPASDLAMDSLPPTTRPRQPYETWTLILGGLVIVAAAAFSFMIGSRIGWLRSAQPASTISSAGPGAQPASTASPSSAAAAKSSTTKSKAAAPRPAANATSDAGPTADELVIYDKNKVVFRMKPLPAQPKPDQKSDQTPDQPFANKSAQKSDRKSDQNPGQSSPSASTQTAHQAVWLAPAQAESRLIARVEPQYPADALAAHRSGNVTLEVHVAEDGAVTSVRPLSGDPLLADAAAQAIRNWRYQPYRANDQPRQFQTDVTLTFSLPN